jgi:hypothetical protein
MAMATCPGDRIDNERLNFTNSESQSRRVQLRPGVGPIGLRPIPPSLWKRDVWRALIEYDVQPAEDLRLGVRCSARASLSDRRLVAFRAK